MLCSSETNGFVLLNEWYSIAAALSAVVMHFPVYPRRIWYDNAWNAFDSAIFRIPWFMRLTMLVVDIFQFSGNVWSNMFNGKIHRLLDTDISVAAEVINGIMDKVTSHIAYLKGNNLIPFMKIIFAEINAAALIRDYVQWDDLEDDNLIKLFRERFKCYCHMCTTTRYDGKTDEASCAMQGSSMPGDGDGIDLFSRGNERLEIPMPGVYVTS